MRPPIESRPNAYRDRAECGARRLRRFSLQNESRPGISSVLSLRTMKRAKARAPLLISTSVDKLCISIRELESVFLPRDYRQPWIETTQAIGSTDIRHPRNRLPG